MIRISRVGRIASIFLLCLICDQATKIIAQNTLAASPPLVLLHGTIRLQYAENPVALFGLGAELANPGRFLLSMAFVGMVLAAVVALAARTRSLGPNQIVGLCLLAAGGVGNAMNRLTNQGSVIDFASLQIGPFQSGIFNVADIAIVVGVSLFLMFSARDKARAYLV